MARFLETKGLPKPENKMLPGNRSDQGGLPKSVRTKVNIDPKAKALAQTNNINWQTLPPSGKNNTVTVADVQEKINEMKAQPKPSMPVTNWKPDADAQ